jgi:Enoyl-CoA hydratase/isomerase
VSAEQVLLSDDRDGVRTLTLNRPDRKNATNAQLWKELADALRAAARDSNLRLVITGAGGAFCSGADISTPEDIHPKDKLRRLTEVARALHELAVPTIAKVTGVAVGAGWNLALGCNFVVATPESRFCHLSRIWRPDSPPVHRSRLLRARDCSTTVPTRRCVRRWPTKPARSRAISLPQTQKETYAAFAEKREPAFTGRWAVPRSE